MMVWAFQSCFAAFFITFKHSLTFQNISFSVWFLLFALHFHCTILSCAFICPFTARLTVVEVFRCKSLDCSSSRSELLLCISTARLFEQGQAGQHFGQRQFSVDFVVSRAHIDAVSHLLLLSDHCQDTRRHNSLTWAKSHNTHTQLP